MPWTTDTLSETTWGRPGVSDLGGIGKSAASNFQLLPDLRQGERPEERMTQLGGAFPQKRRRLS